MTILYYLTIVADVYFGAVSSVKHILLLRHAVGKRCAGAHVIIVGEEHSTSRLRTIRKCDL